MLSQKENLIKEGWVETTLGEVVTFSQGFQVSTDYQYPEQKEGFVRFVRIVDYTNEGEKPRYIENPERCYVNENDLVMIRYGSQTAGKIVRGIAGVIANNTFQIKPIENIDKNWLYWFLRQDSIYQFLNKDQSSSTMPAITFTQVGKLEILLPPLPEQLAIAATLSSFDDKIELLREENKTLEEIGKTIFKEWFGKYSVDDELIKADEILEFEKGIEVGSNNYFENKFQVKNPEMFYRVGDISNNGNLSSIYCEKDLLKNKIFKTGDILISFDGTVGRVFIGGNGGYSSGIRRIYSKEKNIKNSFLYFWAKSKQVQETINLYSEGTTIQHAGKSIPYLKIISNQEYINKITETIDPIFTKILDSLYQIQSLSNSRDELLPRLMRGEVRVK